MPFRTWIVALMLAVSGAALAACKTTPTQSAQLTDAQARIATASRHLAGARSHFKSFSGASADARFESATWIVPDAYRGEVVFGSDMASGFKEIGLTKEIMGFRYFGPEVTDEIQWGERRGYATNVARFAVIDFIAIGTDGGVDRCSEFLGLWAGGRKRLSGFICDRTGYEAAYPRAEDFLPTVTVRGEVERIVAG